MAHTIAEASQEQTPRYVFHLIIPNKTRDCIIGEIMANAVFRLPTMELPTGIEYPTPGKEEQMETCIEAQLGICGHIVTEVWNGYNTRTEGTDGVKEHDRLLIEMLNDHATLQRPLQWIHRDDLYHGRWMSTNGDGEQDDLEEQLELEFSTMNGEQHPEVYLMHEAWQNVGWYEQVLSWTRTVLEARNMVMEGRIRQRHRKSTAIVLWCEVKTRRNREIGSREGSDLVFIKATVPSIREAQRTATIRNVIGNIVPEVIGIDETGEIMIQRNGGTVTDKPLDQASLINTILRMQSLSMNRISELEAGGVLVADNQWLVSNIEGILNHELLDECWRRGVDEEKKKMRKRVVDELRSRVRAIQEGCQKTAKLGLPRTIVHGDLHLLNIGSQLKEEGNMYRFFDWTESFIGNPLIDLERVLTQTDIEFAEYSVDYETGVKQVYEHWEPCCTLAEMEDVFPVIRRISDIISLYHLTQQYDACDECYIERQIRVVSLVQDRVDGMFVHMR